MKKFIVPEELLLGILSYLQTKPFAEVSKLIGEIQTKSVEQVDPIGPEEEEKKPKTESKK